MKIRLFALVSILSLSAFASFAHAGEWDRGYQKGYTEGFATGTLSCANEVWVCSVTCTSWSRGQGEKEIVANGRGYNRAQALMELLRFPAEASLHMTVEYRSDCAALTRAGKAVCKKL